MKTNFLILVALMLLSSCQEAPSTDASVDKIKKVETGLAHPIYIEGDATWTIAERMEHYGVPGVSIAVINDGKIEWTKTYGLVDKESKSPVTKNTLFQAASISKPVTAYGALRLVEQKKVALNEDINTFLKSWKLPENEFTKEKKVTIKNLLNHSAGITVHGFRGYTPGAAIPSLIEILNGTDPANSGPSRVDKVPEESFRYSGGGYNILQQMMMDVEEKTFPEIMDELVLQPLGMNNSTYQQPLEGQQLSAAATGYLPDGSMVEGKRNTYPEMAPAGLWTTAGDVAKFAINIQETLKGQSNKGLSKDMTRKMLKPFVEDHIGLGIFITKKKDETYFGHGGWNRGFSSELIAHKDKGYGVVVLTNTNHPAFISELIRSVALTYQWDDYVPSYKKMKIEPALVAEISGRYQMNGNRIIEVYQNGDQLLGKEIGADPVELIKISDSSYVRREREGFIQFKVNPEDKTMNMLSLNPEDRSIVSTFPRMDKAAKMPIEMLVEGRIEEALAAYQALQKEDPKDPTVDEDQLNVLGYRYLSQDKTKIAQAVFKVNLMLYPESSNVYDSYAEACMELGEKALAIENYTKSLSLNPKNNNAREMIKKLEGK